MSEFETNLPDGVFTAAITPMNKDLSVNYDALNNHIRWLLDNGSDGICLLGTTGEANSFTVEERIKVIDEVIAGGIPAEKLLVGTGCCAHPDTIKLTKRAMKYNVGGILMLPPFYYKGLSDDGISDYFKLVIREVNDDHMRIYLYHFPVMTGVPFTVPLLKRLIDENPGIIVGMKDSGGDLENMRNVCESIPGFKMYAGTEKFLLDTLRLGGPGCITATGNATVKHAAEVYANWQTSEADALQENLNTLRRAFEVTSFVSGLKYLFSKWRNDPDWLNVRPPNAIPDRDSQQLLESNLEAIDFT